MLTSKVREKISLPHEEGQWIELRKPGVGMLEHVNGEVNPIAATLEVLDKCILSWSYEDPVTPENVRDLDAETVRVLESWLFPQQTEETRKKD